MGTMNSNITRQSQSPMAPAAGGIRWEGDLPAPTTTYARSVTGSSFGGVQDFAASTVRTRSAMVVRIPRRNGIRYFYGHGGEEMPLPNPYPGGNDGQVRISMFQRFKVHLFDFVLYDGLFSAGYPRNLGLSFRVPQIRTQPTGGPTVARMQQSPRFHKVQTVGRYSTVPQSYATKAANS